MSEFRISLAPRATHIITISPGLVLSVLALAALVFVPVLETGGALGFLVFGCLLILRQPVVSAMLCVRYWYVLALPIFCLVSFFWSQFPEVSLRFGLQLLVTTMIAVVIASQITPRAFCRTLFALFSVAIAISFLSGNVRADTGALLGIYGSKNAMANAAAVFIVIAAAQVLDHRADLRFRQLAVLGVVAGTMILMLAQSISALLVVPPALLILVSLMLLHRLTPGQRLVAICVTAMLGTLGAILAGMYFDLLLAKLLDVTDKDATLTGRTDLWRVALDLIRERPLFGVGYQAFWVRENAPAESLWFMFGIDSRSGFNFHNTYLSNAVEIGIVGVMIQMFLLYGAALLTGVSAFRRQDADASLLFALVMMVVIISFVEVPVFFQFSLRTVIVICAFVFALRALRHPGVRPAAQIRPTAPRA
ncbi:O-antigen ligase family protein [Roseovarius aestuarii]|uniref:O-Antigen ligase n=1 Tax=Roseovarius aestuarii TaxID=475083 RepID=A0A1X7BUF9_9RHOB|nr:O-antigen ligase family protein [Roseovarius aestuarii]SMC12859.1 O-Antigen ligase [Roseovarius aestuarii]